MRTRTKRTKQTEIQRGPAEAGAPGDAPDRAAWRRTLERARLIPLLAIASGCVAPAKAEAPAQQEEAALVRVAPVDRGPIARPIRAAGVVRAKHEIDLSFKVGGVLREVRVEKGAAVHRGQILATLDPTELDASVRQAREALAKAKRDLDRARRLRATGATSESVLDDAETAFALADAGAKAAEFNAEQGAIVAPQDGWVDAKLAEPGEVVAPGRPIIHLAGTGNGWVVRAALSDRDAMPLALGAPATVTLDAVPDSPIPGTVSQLARVAAPGTGTFEAEIRLAPPRSLTLLSGLAAKVRLEQSLAGVVAVPAAALVDMEGKRGFVYGAEGERAHRVPVDVLFLTGERAIVRGDLGGTETVVTEGAARLTDGARLRIASAPVTASSEAAGSAAPSARRVP